MGSGESSGDRNPISLSDNDMNELQRNTLSNLKRTLSDLASLERQLQYKQAVPFVHIPIELLAQVCNYARLGEEAAWFQELFSAPELAEITALRNNLQALFKHSSSTLPDLPDIFEHPHWLHVVATAQSMLSQLAYKLPA
jgi:hypothetical protein